MLLQTQSPVLRALGLVPEPEVLVPPPLHQVSWATHTHHHLVATLVSVSYNSTPPDTLSRGHRSLSQVQMPSSSEQKVIHTHRMGHNYGMIVSVCHCLQKTYPLAELQLIGSVRLPRGVDRTKLEVSHYYSSPTTLCEATSPPPPPSHSNTYQMRTSGQCSR